MGRYAWFNTKFEYKFYCYQPSSDIIDFGGSPCDEYSESDEGSENSHCHLHLQYNYQWDQEDVDEIINILKGYRFDEIETYKFDEIDFTQFDNNDDGTYELQNWLFCNVKSINHDVLCKYIVGILIYHQLLYINRLKVSYE